MKSMVSEVSIVDFYLMIVEFFSDIYDHILIYQPLESTLIPFTKFYQTSVLFSNKCSQKSLDAISGLKGVFISPSLQSYFMYISSYVSLNITYSSPGSHVQWSLLAMFPPQHFQPFSTVQVLEQLSSLVVLMSSYYSIFLTLSLHLKHWPMVEADVSFNSKQLLVKLHVRQSKFVRASQDMFNKYCHNL